MEVLLTSVRIRSDVRLAAAAKTSEMDSTFQRCPASEAIKMPLQSVNRTRTHRMTLDGAMLNRGFWLYVCKVSLGHYKFFYVGMTGDSSSLNAASPFLRFARHLDTSRNARSNSLFRALAKARINPSDCRFEILAFGPLYSETRSAVAHRLNREKPAALEIAVTTSLRQSRYHIIGTHGTRLSLTPDQYPILEQILTELNLELRLRLRSPHLAS